LETVGGDEEVEPYHGNVNGTNKDKKGASIK
jgi:hypothetical protein